MGHRWKVVGVKPTEEVRGEMWLSFSCFCVPPKKLTSDGVNRCEDCGTEIVVGAYDPGPRLRLVRDPDGSGNES